MARKGQRAVKVTANLGEADRAAVLEWLDQQMAVLVQGRKRSLQATKISDDPSLMANYTYYKNAVGAIKWLRAQVTAKPLPQKQTT